ncbi:hypothetical protein P153DRAFT_375029 [Dothidotthia symphoricarpi CBS 119687]|uniref:Hydrophobin n=1 Tax=Dothidotthia symphoricarpi CBS 119687 TaxID=1392245 RepID=A0A6A6AE77_9PLEO|nr:uncharacterized protein P153DRAFT_375029 [Dothidotthia symphoricarpi CBS 119687]KAF2130232.1 hypothetical protein P153DRAFT_375029 [Dothidotthia symphoricarpi CBS 119687]
MKFTLALATLLSVTSAVAVTRRHPATLSKRQSSVCGGIATPTCCQLDVLGAANLDCESAGDVATTAEFEALCAESGTSAQCCILPVGADALLCTGA